MDNRLHGELVAAAVEVLLIDAGYQVIPTGIERSLRELRIVAVDRYLGLAPQQLRTTPDFFVLDLDADEARLVEVKFRHYLHEDFLTDVEAIRRNWSPFVLVLVLADPPDEWTGEIRPIRAFEIGQDTDLTRKSLLGYGERLQDVFVRLRERWAEGTIVTVQRAITRLVARDEE